MNVLTHFKKNKKEDQKETEPEKSVDQVTKIYGGVSVLKRPYTSERAENLKLSNQYLFLVDTLATKPMIRKEVESRFGVKVRAVNIILKKGKAKHFRNRYGRRPTLKKAIVTLGEGEKLELV